MVGIDPSAALELERAADKARDTLSRVDRLLEAKGCPVALRTVEMVLRRLLVALEASGRLDA